MSFKMTRRASAVARRAYRESQTRKSQSLTRAPRKDEIWSRAPRSSSGFDGLTFRFWRFWANQPIPKAQYAPKITPKPIYVTLSSKNTIPFLVLVSILLFGCSWELLKEETGILQRNWQPDESSFSEFIRSSFFPFFYLFHCFKLLLNINFI